MKLMHFFKPIYPSVWIIRLFIFVSVLLYLLAIKNNFNVSDEYGYAIPLLKGERVFHNFHILSNPTAYITWFFASLFGFQVSAFRVLQITSSIFAALGATALVDIGLFWGLGVFNALLFSSPIIFCNAFVRYGTSAYPDSLAFGVGSVAVNVFIRSLSRKTPEEKRARLIFISGLILGLAGLMHMAFVLVIPVLLLGIFLIFWSNKRKFFQGLRFIFICSSGIFLTLGLGYIVLLPLCLKFIPEQVAYYKPLAMSGYGLPLTIITGGASAWLPGLRDLMITLKTHGALFIPGVHSDNMYLDIILDFPRFFAFILLFGLLIGVLKNWKKNVELSNWIMIFSLAVIFEFTFILFAGLSICRNYVYIILSVLGPLFVAMLILATNGVRRYRVFIFLFAFIMMFYSIFGIEGILEITTHDNRPFMKVYKDCAVHTPRYLQLPSSPHTPLYPKCCYDGSMFEKYGHLGPSVDFLKESEAGD